MFLIISDCCDDGRLLTMLVRSSSVTLLSVSWSLLVSITGAGAGADLSTQVQELTYQDGDTALLPCDITNSSPGDRVTLLLWYKEDSRSGGGMGSPIYRIDARTNNHDIAIGECMNEDDIV